MICSPEIRLAPSVVAMNAFIEPHRQWIESVLGCPTVDSVTFEVEVPFGQLVAEDILKGVTLDRQCLRGADTIRSEVLRWELPPGVSPISANLSGVAWSGLPTSPKPVSGPGDESLEGSWITSACRPTGATQ